MGHVQVLGHAWCNLLITWKLLPQSFGLCAPCSSVAFVSLFLPLVCVKYVDFCVNLPVFQHLKWSSSVIARGVSMNSVTDCFCGLCILSAVCMHSFKTLLNLSLAPLALG